MPRLLVLGIASACLAGSAGALGGDPVAPPAPRWGAEYFPNVPLVTHEGRTVRFFDDVIRDKVVAINFIYTSCPDACPLETAKLSEVQQLLGDRVGKDVFFYSISIDPERDTPAVLAEYRERFQIGDGWTFLTGEREDIQRLREKLGMIDPDGETALQQHSLNLLIGNQATGKWIKRSPFENPYLLATQIGGWLHNWKLPPEPGLDYADAPELRSITLGENLFRTRCAACHVIGAEDGLKRQGPNLLGVTERRERAWLMRWLAEPDVMLAEGDPLALQLFEANRRLPMPNMRLAAVEIEALMGYMEDESRRYSEEVASLPRPKAAVSEEVPPCCQKEESLVLGSADEAPGEPRIFEPAPQASPGPRRLPAERPARAILACAGLALALGAWVTALARRR